MAKVPVGSIPVSEAFQRFHERQYANALPLESLSALDRLREEIASIDGGAAQVRGGLGER